MPSFLEVVAIWIVGVGTVVLAVIVVLAFLRRAQDDRRRRRTGFDVLPPSR